MIGTVVVGTNSLAVRAGHGIWDARCCCAACLASASGLWRSTTYRVAGGGWLRLLHVSQQPGFAVAVYSTLCHTVRRART